MIEVSKQEELLPCPFCGDRPALSIRADVGIIFCQGCGAQIERGGRRQKYKTLAAADKAIRPSLVESWNRRVK